MGTESGIRFFDAVSCEAAQCGSLYRDIRPCRDDLLEFMDINGWFGLETSGHGDHILISSMETVREPLHIWMMAYRRPALEKTKVMLEAYRKRFPNTCQLFEAFIHEKEVESSDRAWKLLDYLLSSLDKDITECTEAEFRQMAEGANEQLPVVSARLFSEFLTNTRKGSRLSDWHYTFHARRIIKRDDTAYPVESFSAMAYCVFNMKSWAENRLVEKAAESKRFAGVWLFCALHFVCALRRTDMKRLPAPPLPLSGKLLRQEIQSGKFSGEKAVAFTEELVLRLKMKPLKPSKTARYGGVPEIKLFIPESLQAPFGIIMALSLSYREEGSPFVEAEADAAALRCFFGSAFVRETGGRRFSSRRANKAYLQGIELTSQDVPGRAKGYMLAALARSHKGGIGSLPEITDIYLKDAAFSGYRPEFILREMFERGIFGFIPALLLERYAKDAYRALAVHGQTALIRCLGLEPVQIERVARSVDMAMAKASRLVENLLETGGKTVGQLLQTIATGAAPSKHPECLCLQTAMGLPCHEPGRSCCIGCGYEIYTKSALHLLMKEHSRLCALRRESAEPEADRYGRILETAVMPAVWEILSSIKALYPEADVEPLLDIIERGLRNADCSEC